MIFIMILTTGFLLWLLAALCLPHLKDEKTPKWRRALCVAGYIYDCAWNMTVGCFVFWELPERIEPLTARLKRHYKAETWRGSLSRFLCRIIHKLEEGHCL